MGESKKDLAFNNPAKDGLTLRKIMWNVNIIENNHQLTQAEIRKAENAYRDELEKYGVAAVLMQADSKAGLDAGVDHFESAQDAWSWLCGKAWEAAMSVLGFVPNVHFEETWIQE